MSHRRDRIHWRPPIRRAGQVVTALVLTAAFFFPAVLYPAAANAATLPATGALRASGGGPASDGLYVIVFRLYDAPDAPQHIWEELQSDVDVQLGTFAVSLGAKTPIDDALLLAGTPLWLGVQVAGDVELPRVALTSVPRAWFAQHAASADTAAVADTALVATSALLADKATNADLAAVANQAFKADVAAQAEELACTGCIGPTQLSPAVANAYLPVTGGVLSGPLGAPKGIDLAGGALHGAVIAPDAVTQTACAEGDAGRVVFDPASKRLHLCDGGGWWQLAVCSNELCKAPSQVPCGAPIPTDCGNFGSCPGAGALCAEGKVCSGGQCVGPGGSAAFPGLSCKAILAADPQATDGTYWLDFDGDGGMQPAEFTCDMQNGGWTAIYAHDFEDDTATGWSMTKITSCGAWGKMLGGFGAFAGGSFFINLQTPGDHGQARVKLDFRELDSSDNEQGYVRVDGGNIWTVSLPHCGGPNVCGIDNCGDSTWSVDQTVGHSKTSLELRVGSSLNEAATNESIGVDNVEVWVK